MVNEGAIVSEEASVDNELPIPVATVEDALQQLGLGNFNAKLQTEQMDMDSLVRLCLVFSISCRNGNLCCR